MQPCYEPSHLLKEQVLSAASAEAQTAIAAFQASARSEWVVPTDVAAWRQNIDEHDRECLGDMRRLEALLPVHVRSIKLGEVPAYEVLPISDAVDGYPIVLQLHSGAYVAEGGELACNEAMLIAARCQVRVLALDYRMAPDHPFPAALNDVMTAWSELLSIHSSSAIGLAGSSAGGGLALASVLRMKQMGLPLPGALVLASPWSDLRRRGDTYLTNDEYDITLSGGLAYIEAAARLYADGRDLDDPLLSPVFGDFRGCPPTLMLSGTRDLFLSNSVRMHRRLRSDGVDAELHVFEAFSHCQQLNLPMSQESEEWFREQAAFLARHLR